MKILDVLHNVDDLLGHCMTREAGFAASTEGNLARSDGEKSMIFTDLHIFPRFDFGAALADDDSAWFCGGTVSELNAQIFWVRIVEVFR